MRDVRVYINGVKIPDKLIINVSIRYEKVPGVTRCTLNLLDYYGVFTNKPLVELEQELKQFNLELLDRYKFFEFKKGDEVVANQPLLVEGDNVWVFVKINNVWWWGFFGYVGGWEYSYDLSGRRSLTVSCEDGLRPLRLEKVVMHELLAPNFISASGEDEKAVKSVINRWLGYEYTPLADNLQGVGFYEKIRKIFAMKPVKAGTKEVTAGGVKEAQPDYIEPKFSYYTLTNVGWSLQVGVKLDEGAKFKKFVGWGAGLIYGSILVGNDNDLEDMVKQLIDELEKNSYVQRSVILLVIVFDKEKANNIFSFLTTQLNFSSLNVSHIAGVVRIELLKRALEGAGYECFVLPSGDVIIEPFWFGMLKTPQACAEFDRKVSEKLGIDTGTKISVIDRQRLTSFSIGYSGDAVKNVVSVKWGLSIIGQPELPVPATSVYSANKVYRHGFKEVFPSFFMWNVSDENIAKALGYYELIRNWWLVRTMSCSIVNPDVIYLPNRPVYYEEVDGIFHIGTSGFDIDRDKKMKATITAKGGLFNNGKGEYKLECFMNEGKTDFEIKDILDCFLATVDKLDGMSVTRKKEEAKKE
jgi:hypothetical protein